MTARPSDSTELVEVSPQAPWHTLSPASSLEKLKTDPARGLDGRGLALVTAIALEDGYPHQIKTMVKSIK